MQIPIFRGNAREIKVEIRLGLLAILEQIAGSQNLTLEKYSRRGEIYSRKLDRLPANLFPTAQHWMIVHVLC
jgi:hypothetical protein